MVVISAYMKLVKTCDLSRFVAYSVWRSKLIASLPFFFQVVTNVHSMENCVLTLKKRIKLSCVAVFCPE